MTDEQRQLNDIDRRVNAIESRTLGIGIGIMIGSVINKQNIMAIDKRR